MKNNNNKKNNNKPSLYSYFKIQTSPISFKQSLLIAFLMYLVIIATRLFVFYLKFDGVDSWMMDNGDYVPIWNADGGLYGYYAKNILLGHSYPFIAEYMPGHLLSFISKYITFSLDRALFFTPLFVSSLISFPIILLGYLLNLQKLFIYSLCIGIFGLSYFARTNLGFYDSDFLNIFFVLSIIANMIWTIQKNSILGVLIASILIILFSYWYHSYESIVLFLLGVYALYTIVYAREFIYQSLLVFTIAFLPIDIYIKIAIIIAILFIILAYKKYIPSNKIHIKYYRYISLIIAVFICIYLFFEPALYERAINYIFKENNLILTQNTGNNLYFSGELVDVLEASSYSFSKISTYLSLGGYLLVGLSLIGLIAITIQFPPLFMLSSFSFFIIIAMYGGIRFSFFATFATSMGIAYFLCIFEQTLEKFHYYGYIFFYCFLTIILITHFQNIKNLQNVAFLNSQDISAIRKTSEQANKKDFLISSWTYGWNIWYYSKFYTLIDNGKHHHNKFILAKLLFSDTRYSALASRYFLEKCPKSNCNVARHLYKNNTVQSIDEEILSSDKKLIKKTKDIYFFLHERMLLSANYMINDLQIYNKEKWQGGGKYFAEPLKSIGNKLHSDNFVINQTTKTITVKKTNTPTKFNHLINIKKNNKIEVIRGDKKSDFFVIIYKAKFLIVTHKDILNSFLIQTFIFNNINPKFFELIETTSTSKVLKLKI